MKNFAAPTFDIAESGSAGRQLIYSRIYSAFWKVRNDLFDDRQGLKDFLPAHDHPALDVAFTEDWHSEFHLVIEGVREIAPQVAVDFRGASNNAHDAEVASDLGLEDAGGFEAVARA